jgi:hypothetical protein
MLLVGGYLSP